MNNKDVAKFIINQDELIVEKVRNVLNRNLLKYGKMYCPCILHKFHDDDAVCPCKDYRETGFCRCGLYSE